MGTLSTWDGATLLVPVFAVVFSGRDGSTSRSFRVGWLRSELSSVGVDAGAMGSSIAVTVVTPEAPTGAGFSRPWVGGEAAGGGVGVGGALPITSGGLAAVLGQALGRSDTGGFPAVVSWSSRAVATRLGSPRRVCPKGVPGLVTAGGRLASDSGVALLSALTADVLSRGVTMGGGCSWVTRSGPLICWRATTAASRALASASARAAGEGGKPPARGARPGGVCALGAVTLRSGSPRSAVTAGSLGLGTSGRERPLAVGQEGSSLGLGRVEGIQVSAGARVPSFRLPPRLSSRRDLGPRSAIVLDVAAATSPGRDRSRALSGRWHPAAIQ